MPGSGRAEIYFIVAMMILTFILSGVAMYAFARTYRKEMREREIEATKRKQQKEREAPENA